MVFAGVDKTGNRVFGTHPSGTYRGYKARAEGAGRETVFNILKEEYKEEMDLKETTKLVVKCLAKALEARQLPTRIKVAVVSSETKKMEMLSEEKIEGILKEIGVGK
jgi:20S proteasome alpha/beta subunit